MSGELTLRRAVIQSGHQRASLERGLGTGCLAVDSAHRLPVTAAPGRLCLPLIQRIRSAYLPLGVDESHRTVSVRTDKPTSCSNVDGPDARTRRSAIVEEKISVQSVASGLFVETVPCARNNCSRSVVGVKTANCPRDVGRANVAPNTWKVPCTIVRGEPASVAAAKGGSGEEGHVPAARLHQEPTTTASA